MRTQCKMDIHEPGSGPSPDIKFDSTLILSIPVSRTVRNKCSLFKLPIYGNLSTWAKTLFLAISLFLTWGQSLAGKKRWGWYLLPKVTKPHLTGGWTPLPLALTMPIWRQWTPSYTLWVPTLFFVFFKFFGHATYHVGSWFPDQGLNPCLLYWKQSLTQPLDCQRSLSTLCFS